MVRFRLKSRMLLGLAFSAFFLALANPASAYDHEEAIRLNGMQLPADDLVDVSQGASTILNPEEAWQLAISGKQDLSLLDPSSSSNIWSGEASSSDASDSSLAVSSDSLPTFLGSVSSQEGISRFNIQIDGRSPKTLTVLLSKTAHTFLLRRALLARLGYKLPPMAYTSQLRVRFPTVQSKRDYLTLGLPQDTYGAASRWVANPNEISGPGLVVTFQDVVLLPSRQDTYNLALAAPVTLDPNDQIQPLRDRTLRSLIVPYALADLGESVNQYEWIVGRISDQSVVLPSEQPENFSSTSDDAKWILRRIANLSRHDIEQIVAAAALPTPVAELVTEKLISRRNHLLKLFGIASQEIAFDSKVTDAPYLKNGKILALVWPGYASRFAYGDPDSPTHDIKFLGLSALESNAISNLVAFANNQIPHLSIEGQTQAHNQKLLLTLLTNFLKTGSPGTIPMKVWKAPIASGDLSLSRAVVIGSYLGTNNLLQLADSVGFTGAAGFTLGLDGLPGYLSFPGMIEGSVSTTYTHLKPLTTMKQSVTQPFRNMVVPWLQFRAAGRLKKIAGLQSGGISDPDELKKELGSLLDEFRKYLGVGESLIVTETLGADESIAAQIGLSSPLTPSATGKLALKQLVISRLHVFRKDENTIQIFKDRGDLGGIELSAELDVGKVIPFPIFSLSLADKKGSANIKYSNINLNGDPEQNPGIFSNAAALSSLLKTGSTELLEQNNPPLRIKIHFNDSSSAISFFHWKRRGLTTSAAMEAVAPDGSAAKYLSLSGGVQKGVSYQSLATNAASYVVERLTDGKGGIQTLSAEDPGQSFLGHSKTRDAQFQSRADNGVADPFVRIAYRWEGWNISQKDALKLLNDLNERYGFSFYSPEVLNQVSSIKLYSIAASLDIHKKGLLKLATLSKDDLGKLIAKYSNDDDAQVSEAIERFQNAWSKYQSLIRKKNPKPKDVAKALLALADSVERFVPFSDLVRLLGGPENYYLYSVINGYRVGSENDSAPIFSNTLGEAQNSGDQGPVDQLQSLLGIETGEFNANWLRDVL